MEYEEFMDIIGQKVDLSNPSERENTVDVVLETLSERISATERDDLAAQLPDKLKEILYRAKTTERYPLEEFYNRITLRLDIGFPLAVKRSRAILTALKSAASRGQIEDILQNLPQEYRELFTYEDPESPSSPTSKSPDEPYAEPTN